MVSKQGFYGGVVEKLIRDSGRAILGLRGFRSTALREYLRHELAQLPGGRNSLLADPVFEAAFGWRESGVSMANLVEQGLLNSRLVDALANPVQHEMTEDYTFPLSRQPYQHQLEAWRALISRKECRSVLVTSGTGSGKTECFLVPILNDLAAENEAKRGVGEQGVRAIFLYPLNALIKSQKERLQAWSEPFGGHVRFCLYNGDTPDQGKSEWLCEVPDRRTLRKQPPQILVTNPTMLEYMLVRTEDRPILDQSQKKLRWIVIDEAHTYLGSQAAELTLLLRRTLHAFGCKPGEVHFVATSATLGDGSERSKHQLAQFLADIAGVPLSQVTVVHGARQIPPEAKPSEAKAATVCDPESLKKLNASELYAALAASRMLLGLRDVLATGARDIGYLAEMLYGSASMQSRQTTLELLDICASARDTQDAPFLPLRAHLFHRTLSGLWACVSPLCEGRKRTLLDCEEWPFGAIHLARRERCDCGSPVFELAQCGSCGHEYLLASEVTAEGKDYLRSFNHENDEDEFLDSVEPPQEDIGEQEEWTDETHVSSRQHRLITAKAQATHQNVGLADDGELDLLGHRGQLINLRLPEAADDHLRCFVCRESSRSAVPLDLFRPVRIGAPFLLTSTTPVLLNAMPSRSDSTTLRPLDGRRLITFTDSRQGTARTVVKAQQQIERDYVGSLLYHHLAAKRTVTDSEQIEKAKKVLIGLEAAAASNSLLKGIVEEKRAEIAKMLNPGLGELSWAEAATKISTEVDFLNWMKPALREMAFNQLSDNAIVELCLMREFLIRPKRVYSLEGLGLVQMRYPGLAARELPNVLQSMGLAKADWQALLHVSVDFFLRSGKPAVEIDDNVRRWIGYPGNPAVIKPPQERTTGPTQRSWPSALNPYHKRNRLLQLVARALRLNLESDSDKRRIDEVLGLIWIALRDAKVLMPVTDGYRVVLRDSAVISAVDEVWLCPVTHRLLPVVFRDITPYLPGSNAPDSMSICTKFKMPVLPDPFWKISGRDAADGWLESDPDVLKLREVGAWINISDRIARFARYFRAAEHSAQLSGHELTIREREFKDGKINLLSCSTTMEMGVDIGGLTAVAMNNVPPHPANFLQRAGRAGRRGESAALSFTLCKGTPHGEAVFRNPMWPFTTPLASPRVDLRSAPIVLRHVNSLALATYLRCSDADSGHRLRAGWFFERPSEDVSAPVDRFIDWCETSDQWPSDFRAGVEVLVRSSLLQGRKAEVLLASTAETTREVSADWRMELNGMLLQKSAVQTKEGNSKPEIAISMQLERWRKSYLLGELATRGLLPGYSFPTGVVPLVTTTMEDLERDNARERREDNQNFRAGFPTRDLPLAIRDYAPGTDTVINGRVYRSAGVTLNWQIPAEVSGAPEIQDLRWMWRCGECRENGTRLSLPSECPNCGNDKRETFKSIRFLQPSGFAVDIRAKPHNDITVPKYIPVREPLITMQGAEWMMLPNPVLGRYRINTNGHLFHHSAGVNGSGYSICLRCGRAESCSADDVRPKILEEHKRLRGGKLNDREAMCPGNSEAWAILDGVRLGVSNRTEIAEIQLHSVAGVPLIDEVTAFTLAVAMKRALAAHIGIEEAELGTTTARAKTQRGENVVAVQIFDTANGGAGYSSQIASCLPELLRSVRDKMLECPNDCDSACQGCLLTYETQHQIERLNRHHAREFLSAQFLSALELNSNLKIYGDSSRLELEPLVLAMSREWQKQSFTSIILQLGGDVRNWTVLDWQMLEPLQRYRNNGVQIKLVTAELAIEQLEQAQRDDLAALLAVVDAELYICADIVSIEPSLNVFPVLELLTAESARCWAATNSDSLVPGSTWGNGESGAQFVKAELSQGLISKRLTDCKLMPRSELRKQPPGVVELCISAALDGNARDFGKAAWVHIAEEVSSLRKRLEGDVPLTKATYVDRYVRSPLTLLLVVKLLAALKEYSGGISSDTSVEVRTSQLGKAMNEPGRVFQDWIDSEDRKDVAQDLLAGSFSDGQWVEAPLHEMPHARELRLEWTDGECWVIRLDQGVGYWRLGRGSRSEFPFNAATPSQLKTLQNAQLYVEGAKDFVTYWYCLDAKSK